MSSPLKHIEFSTLWERRFSWLDILEIILTVGAIAFKCTLAYAWQLRPIYQKLTFLHFRTLICVKRICMNAHDIAVCDIYSSNNLSCITFLVVHLLYEMHEIRIEVERFLQSVHNQNFISCLIWNIWSDIKSG